MREENMWRDNELGMVIPFRKFYQVFFIKKFDKCQTEGMTKDKSSRIANMYAVEWTPKAWRRQYTTMRNIFNPEGW